MGPVDNKLSFTKEVYDAKGKQIGWAIHCGDDISFVPVPSGYQEYADEEDGKIGAAAGSAGSASRPTAEAIKGSPRPQSLRPTTPNKIYDADGDKARAKGKKAGAREPILDPKTCEHRTEWLSTKGSNQYYDQVRCDACKLVLRKDATEWWALESERRRIKMYQEARAKEAANTTARSSTAPTADELRGIRSGSARHGPS